MHAAEGHPSTAVLRLSDQVGPVIEILLDLFLLIEGIGHQGDEHFVIGTTVLHCFHGVDDGGVSDLKGLLGGGWYDTTSGDPFRGRYTICCACFPLLQKKVSKSA